MQEVYFKHIQDSKLNFFIQFQHREIIYLALHHFFLIKNI